MQELVSRSAWHASGLRWIAGLMMSAADRLENTLATDASVTAHEMHFDSNAYLAHLKSRIYTQYY